MQHTALVTTNGRNNAMPLLSAIEDETGLPIICHIYDHILTVVSGHATVHLASSSPRRIRRPQPDIDDRIRSCLKPYFEKGGRRRYSVIEHNRADHTDPGMNAMLLMLQRLLTELKFITQRMTKDDDDQVSELVFSANNHTSTRIQEMIGNLLQWLSIACVWSYFRHLLLPARVA
jgi:hypothetical protein